MMSLCCCGSNKAYADCCEPFILGTKLPATPEQLMRSRYSAYSQANIAYIEKTMKGEALKGFDAKEAKKWAKQASWLGLSVIKAPIALGNTGFVEFIARYALNGKAQAIHEVSEFHFEGDRWYYVRGDQS